MTPSEWLRYIKPPPGNDEELSALTEDFDRLVEDIRECKKLDTTVFAKEKKEHAKLFGNVVKALDALPVPVRHFYKETRDDFERMANRAQVMAVRYAVKQGRPRGKAKDACIIECKLFLLEHGSRATEHRGGTVCGLSRVVWQAAFGEVVGDEVWDQISKRLALGQ